MCNNFTLFLPCQVVRSLKHALQPAAKNISATFTVPSGFSVLSVPTYPPPVFSGEKLVLYGIIQLLDNETVGLDGLSGEIELKATIHEAEFCSKTPFKADGTSLYSEMPAVHHLAAKALLMDMENEGKPRTDVVKLSVESGVVSSNTAFVAVDEHTSEPVSGPMKSYDLLIEGNVQSECPQYHT